MGLASPTTPAAAAPRMGGQMDAERGFTVVARVLLAAGLLFTVLISGSDSGRLVTPARLAGAIIGSVVILYYIRNAPRRHDRVDLLVLGGLLLFLLTCATSSAPRLSFEAGTTALAYTATFYVAREAVRDPAGRLLTIAVLGLLGSAVAITVLIPWSVVWVQWLSVPGGGAPPFDLALPSTQYYPVSAAMLVGLLLPATLALVKRPLIWPIGIIGAVASFAVIAMSGSRSLWMGMAGGLAVLWLTEAGWTRRFRGSLIVAAVVVAAVLAVVVMPQLAARILAGSSVDLRLAMWTESLRMWLDSPLVGHGPGSFASAFTLGGFYNSYATYIDHAHSLPVQLLVEAGLVGVLAIALLAGAVVTGMRRDLAGSPAALAAITLFVVLSATADPSVDAFFAVPLIIWAALLSPRSPAEPVPVARPRPSLQMATIAGAAIVAVATGTTLGAALAHDRAAGADGAGDLDGAVGHLSTAVVLDPSNALYRRELGVSFMEAGDAASATRQLERAVTLNRADLAGWRALALARVAAGDDAGAVEAAEQALGLADLHPMNGLAAAFVGMALDQPQRSQDGMVRAVRIAPWILAAPEWETAFPQTPDAEVLQAARDSWGPALVSSRNERARAWLAGIADEEPPPAVGLAAQAEAAVLRCRPDLAAAALAEQGTTEATSQSSLQAQLMLDRVRGSDVEPGLATMMFLHDRNLWTVAFDGVTGQSPFYEYFADVTMYASAPLAHGNGLVFPTESSGLSAWLRDPITAADAGAPHSPLASCR